MTEPRLGPGREFDRVRRIAAALGPRAARLDDDCAVLAPSDRSLVASTDVSVEGVHFRLDWLSLEEIGWRAAAAALSDLAADGAEAAGLLAALTVPAAAEDSEVALAHGWRRGRRRGGGRRGTGWRSLRRTRTGASRSTVLGGPRGRSTRPGARPGDGIWVTGSLGGAASRARGVAPGRVADPRGAAGVRASGASARRRPVARRPRRAGDDRPERRTRRRRGHLARRRAWPSRSTSIACRSPRRPCRGRAGSASRPSDSRPKRRGVRAAGRAARGLRSRGRPGAARRGRDHAHPGGAGARGRGRAGALAGAPVTLTGYDHFAHPAS